LTKVMRVGLAAQGMAMQHQLLRAEPRIYHTYTVWVLFDTMMVLGTLVLLACYVWARSLGHVGRFCDISDLVVHLPERILFRLNFSLVGGLLTAIAVPIHDVVSSRLAAGKSTTLPKVAAAFQIVSGVGVIMVGACGPEEIMPLHLTAAVMGFGGAAVSQLLYNGILYGEERASSSAKWLHTVRCVISTLFLLSAVLLGLGEAKILPEPAEHIFEWCLWFFLLAWYFTFRWDLDTFCLASVTTAGGQPMQKAKSGKCAAHVIAPLPPS